MAVAAAAAAAERRRRRRLPTTRARCAAIADRQLLLATEAIPYRAGPAGPAADEPRQLAPLLPPGSLLASCACVLTCLEGSNGNCKMFRDRSGEVGQGRGGAAACFERRAANEGGGLRAGSSFYVFSCTAIICRSFSAEVCRMVFYASLATAQAGRRRRTLCPSASWQQCRLGLPWICAIAVHPWKLYFPAPWLLHFHSPCPLHSRWRHHSCCGWPPFHSSG